MGAREAARRRRHLVTEKQLYALQTDVRNTERSMRVCGSTIVRDSDAFELSYAEDVGRKRSR